MFAVKKVFFFFFFDGGGGGGLGPPVLRGKGKGVAAKINKFS